MSSILQLIASIKNSRIDGKVKVLSQISDLLKDYTVDDAEKEKVIDELISLINVSIKAPQFPLAIKAIETAVPVLGFLISNAQPLKAYVTLILPALIDRLGDAKERVREASMNALVDSWRILSVGDCTKDSGPQRRTKALEHFSKLLIELGFPHKAPWGREQSLSLCINCIAKDPDFPLPKFTLSALTLAEDSNESVREKAKTLLLDYFPVMSQESKTTLQRALADSTLKKALRDQINQRILGTSKALASAHHAGHRQTLSGTEIPPSLQCLFEGPDTNREKLETPGLSSASSDASAPDSRASALSLKSPPQPGGLQSAQTSNVYDSKDLQKRLVVLSKAFVGKESDLNWDLRDRELHNLRRLLRGNASTEHTEQLVVFLKEFIESLNKTLLSLRTTLVISALNTAADLSQFLPDGTFDPYCLLIFPTLLKCASSTKKLLAETAHSTLLAYLAHSSYNVKVLGLISSSLSDRSTQLRIYAVSYLISFLTRHSAKPQQFEKRGLQSGLELVKGGLARSLGDANSKARELARQAFSIFHKAWPAEAQVLLKTLDTNTRKQLAHVAADFSSAPSSIPRPSTRLGTMRTRATEASSISRPETSMRTLRPQKSCIALRTGPVLRPSSVMVTSSDRQAIKQGMKSSASFFRSPTSLELPLSGEDRFYSPPRDLNTGTLATEPGISRIPRPPIVTQRPASVANSRPASVASNQRKTRPTLRMSGDRPLSMLSPPGIARNSLSMVKASSEGNEAVSPHPRRKASPTSQVHSPLSTTSDPFKSTSAMVTIAEKPSSPKPTPSAKAATVSFSSSFNESNPQAELHKLLDHKLSFNSIESRKLLRLSRELPLPDNKIAWVRSKNFSRLIEDCISHIQASDPPAENIPLCISILVSLLKHQTALCDPYTADILRTLVDCQRSKLRDISSLAEDALEVFAQEMDAIDCFNVTIRHLHLCLLIEKGSLPEFEDLVTPTSSCFFVLTLAVPRLPHRFLSGVQSELDSLVGLGFHHSSTTVRHHVLSLVLAIQAHLEPDQTIKDFFPRLTPSQLKLVNLYIEANSFPS